MKITLFSILTGILCWSTTPCQAQSAWSWECVTCKGDCYSKHKCKKLDQTCIGNCKSTCKNSTNLYCVDQCRQTCKPIVDQACMDDCKSGCVKKRSCPEEAQSAAPAPAPSTVPARPVK